MKPLLTPNQVHSSITLTSARKFVVTPSQAANKPAFSPTTEPSMYPNEPSNAGDCFSRLQIFTCFNGDRKWPIEDGSFGNGIQSHVENMAFPFA